MAHSDYTFATVLNPYGLDFNNKLVYVDDVPNGLKCGCVCPTCKVPLKARQGEIYQHHFAHTCNENSCLHIQETYFLRTKEILEKEMRIMLPSYDEEKEELINIKSVTTQKISDDNSVLPDIVIDTELDMKIHIRFKRKKGKEIFFDRNENYLELDATNIEINDLPNYLLNSITNKIWKNNPFYEKVIQEIKQKKLEEIPKVNSITDNQRENNPHYLPEKEIDDLQKFWDNIPTIKSNAEPQKDIETPKLYKDDSINTNKIINSNINRGYKKYSQGKLYCTKPLSYCTNECKYKLYCVFNFGTFEVNNEKFVKCTNNEFTK